MTTAATMRVEMAENEVVFTQIINAPQERVFKAWTDPKLLSQWWGPEGFTNPICHVNLRPGGEYRIVMRSPDGVEYPVKGFYLEVVRPERIVFTDTAEEHPAQWRELLNKYRQKGKDEPSLNLLMTVTFTDLGVRTLLTIQTHFATVTDRDAILKMGAAEGWAQSLGKLNRQLVTA